MLEDNVQNRNEEELAKQEFFSLVDDLKYDEAIKYFNELNIDEQTHIRKDKMGMARIKELRFNGYGHI